MQTEGKEEGGGRRGFNHYSNWLERNLGKLKKIAMFRCCVTV